MQPNQERTFIMVKPDGVQRRLVGKIIQRFEDRGFQLVGLKFVHPSQDLLSQHYADLKERPFFPSLIQYVGSGPVCAMVWEGKDGNVPTLTSSRQNRQSHARRDQPTCLQAWHHQR